MPSIRKSLLQFIFAGSFMKRWNDKLRPMELLEVDKQAHKMIAAWTLYRLNSTNMTDDQRLELGRVVVEGGMFEYFYRLVITDIKPPIFYQIKANPDHHRLLTSWVLEQLEPRVQPMGGDFWNRLVRYLNPEQSPSPIETLGRRILTAAHLYASNWEFNLIKNVNLTDDEFQEIEESFATGLKEHSDIIGAPELTQGINSPLGRFTHLCGQLRFQIRWSQTPRIPETSVLGHMFIVACYAYIFSLALGACPARALNNFFAGLFHDLPELLTRDIISPVKKSVRRIGDLIKEYEEKELKRRVLGPLTENGYDVLAERLSFFLGLEVGSEFTSVANLDGKITAVTPDQLQTEFNHDRFDPKDGETLKICDTLAAYIEAYTALRNGISSDQLQQALWRMKEKHQHFVLGRDIHIGALLADFD